LSHVHDTGLSFRIDIHDKNDVNLC
jgi:hypothetical protein